MAESVARSGEELNPFSSAAIALQIRPPWMVARMVSLALCAMAGLAALYAWLAPMDVVVSSLGRVIPSGKSKVVQPLESGIVKAIHVHDGVSVREGDVLIELDHTTTTADRDRLQRDLWEAELESERLGAMARGQDRLPRPAGVPTELAAGQATILLNRLAEQRFRAASLEADIGRRQAERDTILASLTQIRASLPLVRKKAEMREELARVGHIAEAGLIEARLERLNLEKEFAVQESRLREAEAGLSAAIQQKGQSDAEFRSRIAAEAVEAARKRDSIRQELVKASQRQALQVLRAPIDGVVQHWR